MLLRKMIEKTWAWGLQNKRLRQHPIHGEEEVRMVLTETFAFENKNEEQTTRSGTFEVQAGLYKKASLMRYCYSPWE